ncbi:MAG: hypothetical protein M1831_005339 [Alyxoria varia]|nr:MAG: hypothetical protein M1831_005339 [Alyxoria varia]
MSVLVAFPTINTQILTTKIEFGGTITTGWNVDMIRYIFAVIDGLVPYNNVLAYHAWEDDMSYVTSTQAAPYMQALARDVGACMTQTDHRRVPMGYTVADVESLRYPSCSPFFAVENLRRLNRHKLGGGDESATTDWTGKPELPSSGNEIQEPEAAGLKPVMAGAVGREVQRGGRGVGR